MTEFYQGLLGKQQIQRKKIDCKIIQNGPMS